MWDATVQVATIPIELAGLPPACDLDRFPDAGTARVGLAYCRGRRDALHAARALALFRTEELTAAMGEAQRAADAWELLLQVHTNSEHYRRRPLAELRDLLGAEGYARGVIALP